MSLLSSRSPLLSLCILLPALLLAGCVAMPQQTAEETPPSTPRYLQLVSEAPPPPKEETKPIIENPRTQVWRPGYWNYGIAGYDWVPGEVIDRPSPTAVWAPDHWVKHDFGWAFECGAWE